jgi:hypothetical protein
VGSIIVLIVLTQMEIPKILTLYEKVSLVSGERESQRSKILETTAVDFRFTNYIHHIL